MSNNFKYMNPLHGIHDEFEKILSTLVIKYSYLAEEAETFESKRNADEYLSSLAKRDTFLTYRDYTVDEFIAVGINDVTLISRYTVNDGYLEIPTRYQEELLLNRRNKIIRDYNEMNEYYRTLNGLPPLNVKNYHYLTDSYAKKFGVDKNIPIHKIQDYYNNIETGKGDYIISNIEGLGIIDNLISTFPDEEYLHYIGSRRISIKHAREAKNFQILYVAQKTIKNTLFDEFLTVYEQCRDYFVSVIFVREFRKFFNYYDRFIALCIMVMAMNTTINRQFPLGIDREYYNDFTLKMLYEAYGIPHNMKIDQYTQRRICQSLNLLIQKKSTDKVIYDIANMLGFEELGVYKYYLGKERKFDIYGAPIIKYKQEFNNDTGEYETVPDYEAMYDLYFQRVELRESDFIKTFYSKVNKIDYETLTSDDPYWWEDSDLYKQIWETEYNFVESKYLSLAVSYKLSDILYENILLLKMLIDKKDDISSIKLTLPKICPDLEITIFDAVILLFCLTSYKHNIGGEIISIPTQVLSVLDYLHNTDGGDEYLVDSFGFDFKLFLPENVEGQELISKLKVLLGEEDPDAPEKFMSFIDKLTINPDLTNAEKIILINSIYEDIKGLSEYLQYKLCETHNRKTYETIKEFYRAAFYAKEVKDIFTINEDNSKLKRTAKTFFEFLYHYNPKLYGSIFTPNFEGQYNDYIRKNKLDPDNYTLDNYIYDVNYGNIDDFTYSTLNINNDSITVNNDLLYYYIEHIIFRLETIIKNLKFIYMINDASTPLEDLLLKMVRYFKSFTVDCIGLDVIYITDMKSENLMRFFDEVDYICKWIQTHEHIRLSYSDILHLIDARFVLDDNSILINDKEIHNKILLISDHINFIKLRDSSIIESLIYAQNSNTDNSIKLFDTFKQVSSIFTLKDKSKENEVKLFMDKITKLWYDE